MPKHKWMLKILVYNNLNKGKVTANNRKKKEQTKNDVYANIIFFNTKITIFRTERYFFKYGFSRSSICSLVCSPMALLTATPSTKIMVVGMD